MKNCITVDREQLTILPPPIGELIPDIAIHAGISFPTAARAVDGLEQLGILREVTGRTRDRVFAYADYIGILNEGTQPLP